MVACAFCYTIEASIIRSIGKGWPSPVTLFWREVAACAVLFPLVIYLRGAPLRTRQPGTMLFRSATGTLGLLLSIYAIARLPLATATTLSFTRPMWILLLAAFFLGEKMNRWKVLSLLIGFSGILWMVRPGGNIGDPIAAMADIAAALVFAASLVSIRHMTASDSAITILVYGQLLGLIFTAPLAIYFWRTPDWQQLGILLSVGLVSLGTTISYIKALESADASVVGPMEYLRLPFAMIAGLLLLSEVPNSATLIGAALILTGAAVGILGPYYRARRSSDDDGSNDGSSKMASLSVEAIRTRFIEQLSQQRLEAEAHQTDSYRTDSPTGRNISVDEFEAIDMMEGISLQPSPQESANPVAYCERLLADLVAVADQYRKRAQDPDGCGIAAIGTLFRTLQTEVHAHQLGRQPNSPRETQARKPLGEATDLSLERNKLGALQKR